MSARDYRDDDVLGVGYCPTCGRRLSGLTVALRGVCEEHGWQWADLTTTREEDDDDAGS